MREDLDMNPLNQLISVKMMLRHVLYISYLVPASRIRPLVPNVLPLATPFPDQVFCINCRHEMQLRKAFRISMAKFRL